MSRLIFGLIASLILIGISYFSAKVYSLGLRFSPHTTSLLFLCFLITSILFALSIALSRGGSGISSGTLYTFIQVLSGIAFYLFIGAIVLGVCLLAGRIGSFAVPVSLASILVGASVLLGIIGLVQARYITTTEYTVTLQGAPAVWEGKTAALVSDTHFGIVNKERFSQKVVQKILSLQPDFVLHAGDFYDGPALDTVPITASWKQLTEVVPVFYAPGNHEQYGNYAGFIASIKDAGVIVLEDKKVTYDGVAIAGFTYRGANAAATVASLAEGMALKEIPSIAIIHTPTFHQPLAAAGVDLAVSGHTHRGQFWPLNYLLRSIYRKYIYGMVQASGTTAIVTSGVGTFGPPFRLFNPPEIVLIHFTVQ